MLMILINGQMSDATSIIGDNITFVCTIRSSFHWWSVPSLGSTKVIGLEGDTSPITSDVSGVTVIASVVSSTDSLTTSLYVIAVAAFNDSTVRCDDSATMDGQSQVATGVVILGEYPVILAILVIR